MDALANAYIAGRLFVFGEDSLADDIIEGVTRSAYRFAYKAHKERAKALEHIRKDRQ